MVSSLSGALVALWGYLWTFGGDVEITASASPAASPGTQQDSKASFEGTLSSGVKVHIRKEGTPGVVHSRETRSEAEPASPAGESPRPSAPSMETPSMKGPSGVDVIT